MRKIFVTILFLTVFVSAFAQQESPRGGEKDGLNLQIMGGPTFSQNEFIDGLASERKITFSKDAMSCGGYVSLAKEFSTVFGWRANLGYSGNKGRANAPTESVADIYSFKDFEVMGDITLDFMDLFGPKRKSHMFNLKAFAGAGALFTFGFPSEYSSKINTDPGTYFGFRGGLDFRFRLSKVVSIMLEASSLFSASDKFNGIEGGDVKMDARLNGDLGIVFHF